MLHSIRTVITLSAFAAILSSCSTSDDVPPPPQRAASSIIWTTKAIESGTVLTPANVGSGVRETVRASIPDDALSKSEDALGRKAKYSLAMEKIVCESDLEPRSNAPRKVADLTDLQRSEESRRRDDRSPDLVRPDSMGKSVVYTLMEMQAGHKILASEVDACEHPDKIPDLTLRSTDEAVGRTTSCHISMGQLVNQEFLKRAVNKVPQDKNDIVQY